jgi:hypothetical protein
VLFVYLIGTKTEFIAQLCCVIFNKIDLFFNGKVTSFDLLDVELDFVEGSCSRTEEDLYLLDEIVPGTVVVVLLQEISLLDRTIHLLEEFELLDEWREEMIKLLGPLEDL